MILRSLSLVAKRSALFGVVDAGLGSLATFLVGLFAVRTLTASELGGYALCFSAVFLAGIVPSQGYFVPAANLLVGLPQPDRLCLLRPTIQGGVPIALIAAVAVVLWLPFAPSSIPHEALVALTVTAALAAFLSPVQDHVRRMLHLGGTSRSAAVVSSVQIAAVATALLVFIAAGLPKWWAPFGALAFANGVSALVGIWLAGSAVPTNTPLPTVRWSDLRRSGRWLAFLGMVDAAMAFAAATIVAQLAGSAALGYAEAGRVVAQPVTVAAWGLSAVLGPRSVRAGQDLAPDQARRTSRSFITAIAFVGITSLLLFGYEWSGNPLAWLLPNAYVVTGLVILSILANLLNAVLYPFRLELIGGRQEGAIAALDIKANALRSVVAASAILLQAYAVPLSLLSLGLARWLGYRRMLAAMYAGPLMEEEIKRAKVWQ